MFHIILLAIKIFILQGILYSSGKFFQPHGMGDLLVKNYKFQNANYKQKNNQKFLWGSRGHVSRFFKKSPLAAGGKENVNFRLETALNLRWFCAKLTPILFGWSANTRRFQTRLTH